MKKHIDNENFTVGLLIDSKYKPLVRLYYDVARNADNIADDAYLTSQIKLQELEKIEQSFANKDSTSAGELGKLFADENLAYGLFGDLLEAFRRDAKGIKIEIWEQLLDYCSYSAAPVGRFMLAIFDENPSTYLPAETLCTVLQITNHLQDLKYDVCTLRRCYLPSKMMQEFGVRETDFCLQYATPKTKEMIKHIIKRLRAMLMDAKTLLYLVRNRRLKAEIGVILSLTNSMLKRIEKGDVIAQNIKLNKFDWIKALLVGILQGLFIRTKSCSNNLR